MGGSPGGFLTAPPPGQMPAPKLIKEAEMDGRTVPVMIDDRKDTLDFRMTRATYFYIEALEPAPDIPLNRTSLGRSVLTLEFSGVIYRPLGRNEFFETPRQIENLFRGVERYRSLYVDSDNIWIPNELFDFPPCRGEVYRIPFDVFAGLYTLCRDDATLAAGLRWVQAEPGIITRSDRESVAFREWSGGIVAKAKAAYPMNRDLALGWR